MVINRIDAAPANGKALAPDGSLVLPETEASKDPYMKLLDCGGSVTLDYERSAFNIGDTLKGDVIVTDVPLDVQFIRVEFFKIEKGGEYLLSICCGNTRKTLLAGKLKRAFKIFSQIFDVKKILKKKRKAAVCNNFRAYGI